LPKTLKSAPQAVYATGRALQVVLKAQRSAYASILSLVKIVESAVLDIQWIQKLESVLLAVSVLTKEAPRLATAMVHANKLELMLYATVMQASLMMVWNSAPNVPIHSSLIQIASFETGFLKSQT